MNKMLLEQLHRYAEDRQIDYSSAQYLGQQLGVVWKNQKQLVEFKNAIDYYLKTFDETNFAIVENMLNELCGKTTGSGVEAYASKTKVSRPNADSGKVGPSGKGKAKGKGKKKVVKEGMSIEDVMNEGESPCPDCGAKGLKRYTYGPMTPAQKASTKTPYYVCPSCKKKFDKEGNIFKK